MQHSHLNLHIGDVVTPKPGWNQWARDHLFGGSPIKEQNYYIVIDGNAQFDNWVLQGDSHGGHIWGIWLTVIRRTFRLWINQAPDEFTFGNDWGWKASVKTKTSDHELTKGKHLVCFYWPNSENCRVKWYATRDKAMRAAKLWALMGRYCDKVS